MRGFCDRPQRRQGDHAHGQRDTVVDHRGRASVAQLMPLLTQKIVEVRQLLTTIISLTPNGDANLTALDALLAELA
jgi:hypothetical protein